jgi:hypothetical protein
MLGATYLRGVGLRSGRVNVNFTFHTLIGVALVGLTKKFWEEVIAYFPLDCTEQEKLGDTDNKVIL